MTSEDKPKHYNVWRVDQNRWTTCRPNKCYANAIYIPAKLTREEAFNLYNIVVRNAGLSERYKVREIGDYNIPIEMTSSPTNAPTKPKPDVKYNYNLWHIGECRWTARNQNSRDNPTPLSYEEAVKWRSEWSDAASYEIRPISGASSTMTVKVEMPATVKQLTYEQFDVGDRVGVYTTTRGVYSYERTDQSMICTVIGKTQDKVILGWVDNEPHPVSATRRLGLCANDDNDYTWALTVKASDVCSPPKHTLTPSTLQVGDECKLYVDHYNRVVPFYTSRTIPAKVIAKSNSEVPIFGWKTEAAAPLNSIKTPYTFNVIYVEDFEQYTCYWSFDVAAVVRVRDDGDKETAKLKSKIEELKAELTRSRNLQLKTDQELKTVLESKQSNKKQANRPFKHGDHILYLGHKGRVITDFPSNIDGKSVVLLLETASVFPSMHISIYLGDEDREYFEQVASEFGIIINDKTTNMSGMHLWTDQPIKNTVLDRDFVKREAIDKQTDAQPQETTTADKSSGTGMTVAMIGAAAVGGLISAMMKPDQTVRVVGDKIDANEVGECVEAAKEMAL